MRPGAHLIAFAGIVAVAASCGSRTGLFGPDPADAFVDSGIPDGGAFDAEVDGRVPCVPGRFTFELATPQIMFVIDRSGSMAFSLDGRQPVPLGERRWDILRDALAATIVPFDGQLAMGAKFFPEVLSPRDLANSELACRTDVGVALAPARGNAGAILDEFNTTPLGGTPTSEALRIAAQYMVQSRTVARTIVLATDGAPNCNAGLDARTCVCTSTQPCSSSPVRGRYSCLDDARTIDTVRNIAGVQKIPVYVIGIGSTESPAFLRVLDDMAVAGGRPRPSVPRHYNVQSAGELQSALETIRDSVAKCTYLTPSAPTDPNKITVEIDGVPIRRDETRSEGWDWNDQAYGELAFFGDACAEAQAGGARITGVVTCD